MMAVYLSDGRGLLIFPESGNIIVYTCRRSSKDTRLNTVMKQTSPEQLDVHAALAHIFLCKKEMRPYSSAALKATGYDVKVGDCI